MYLKLRLFCSKVVFIFAFKHFFSAVKAETPVENHYTWLCVWNDFFILAGYNVIQAVINLPVE